MAKGVSGVGAEWGNGSKRESEGCLLARKGEWWAQERKMFPKAGKSQCLKYPEGESPAWEKERTA